MSRCGISSRWQPSTPRLQRLSKTAAMPASAGNATYAYSAANTELLTRDSLCSPQIKMCCGTHWSPAWPRNRMRLRSKSFLPSPVPSECSPSRAHPTPNTCSRIWPLPLLHPPLMRCAPSKLWSNSRERHLLQSSHHIRFRQYALVEVIVGISVSRKMGSADTFDSGGYRREGRPKFSWARGRPGEIGNALQLHRCAVFFTAYPLP